MRHRSIARLSLLALVLAGGCAGPVDPYGDLAWIEITTSEPFLPVATDYAALTTPLDLGSGDAFGSVTYESYLTWIAPAEDAALAGVPTAD